MFARAKTWLSAISWKNITNHLVRTELTERPMVNSSLLICSSWGAARTRFIDPRLIFGIDQGIYFQIGGVADEWINRLPEPVSHPVSIAFHAVFYGLFFGGVILWAITLIALPFWLLYCLRYATKVRDGYWKAFVDKALFRV